MPEYEAWAETVNTTGWKIKYYKGLGTSTEEEAQEYFADIDRHRKSFLWAGEGIAPVTQRLLRLPLQLVQGLCGQSEA